jgi:FkbM family methyltransferase
MQEMLNTLLNKVEIIEVGNLKFYVRPNTSDETIVKDNVIRKAAAKHLKMDGNWLDLGGYIGTYAAVVMEAGGKVFSVEADPMHVMLYNANMLLNEFDVRSPLCAAVVQNPKETIQKFTINYRGDGKSNTVAGNTLLPYWKTSRPYIYVPCVAFSAVCDLARKELGKGMWSLKMDIEGSEIEILEHDTFDHFDQLYIEYHFKADPSIERANKVFDKLSDIGFEVIVNHKLPETGNWTYFPSTIVAWCKR